MQQRIHDILVCINVYADTVHYQVTIHSYSSYRVRLMFHGGFCFTYFASRWPFGKLNPGFSTCGNILIRETFARFHEIKSPRNIRRIRYVNGGTHTHTVLRWMKLVER